MTTKTQKAPGIRKIERVRRVPHSNPPKTEKVIEWEARVSLGLHPARRCVGACGKWYWSGEGYPLTCCGEQLGGEQRRKLQRTATRGTRPEAEAWREKTRTGHRNGVSPFKKPEPTKITVAAFAETYLADRKHETQGPNPSLDINTWWRYGQFLDDVCGIIGAVPLDELRARHVREVLVELRRQGKSASTVMQAKRVLNRMLVEAVTRELIELNPAQGVGMKVPPPVTVIPAYADALALLGHCTGRDEVWRLPLALAIATGARRGEVLGILRRNVRFDGGAAYVTIEGVLRRNRETKRIERRAGSKSEGSTGRTLLIDWPEVVTLLRAAMHRPRNLDAEADVVCADDNGHWPDPDQMTKAYRRIAARAGLDARTTLHGLRHSVATFLAEEGASAAAIAAQLGHKDGGALALRVYVDETKKLREGAGATLAGAHRRVG